MRNLLNLRDVTLIEGQSSGAALALVDRGANREEIQRETGDHALLSSINLDIHKGQVSVLAGPDTLGKSSLLRVINGLTSVTRGQIVIDDDGEPVDICHCSEGILRHMRLNHMVLVNRTASLFPQKTLRENCEMGLQFQGLSEEVTEERVSTILDVLGLREDADLLPDEVSEQARCLAACGRAIVMQPELLLFDHPLHRFDAATQSRLVTRIMEACEAHAPAILWATDQLDAMIGVADQVSIMIEGRIRQTDAPERLLSHPQGKDVSRQLTRLNLLDALRASSVITSLNHLPRDPQDHSKIYLDPRGRMHIRLNATDEPISARDGEQELEGQPYDESMDIALLNPNILVAVFEDTPLRIILELQVYSQRPTPVINEHGQMKGAIIPRDLHLALLGQVREPRPPAKKLQHVSHQKASGM